MITKYKQFNEGIKSLLVGPSIEEVKNNISKMRPIDQLNASVEIDYVDGIKNALKNGVNMDSVYRDTMIKIIKIINPSDEEILDFVKNKLREDAFIILICSDKLELAKIYGGLGNYIIHVNGDYPIRYASENNKYEIIKYLLSEDDFNLDVLRNAWSKTTDERIKKLIQFHVDNRQIISLLVFCKNNDLDMVEKLLRRYHFTNEGLDKCIKVTTNESIIDLLEECKR